MLLYKGKGDVLKCENYKKLNLWFRLISEAIGSRARKIDNGLVLVDLYSVSIDLGKAYDRVPCKEL